MSMTSEFKEFILRGSVIDLAVGVLIGGAFGGIVTALTKDIITPFIGMFGKVDLSNLNTTINGAKFGFGDFLNVVISFIILAFVVFFFIVRPVNMLMEREKKGAEPEAAPALTTEEALLTEIRDALRTRSA